MSRRVGVVVINFGEPARPTMEEVVPFLERIFFTNAAIEGAATEEQRRERSRQLAARRAPGLIEEYEAIGGSPLNAQAARQAEMLEAELRRRGVDARVYSGMQFTEPLIEDTVRRARVDGVELLVALPVYPLCGPSTTVAALAQVARAVEAEAWDVALRELSGWHAHPDYVELRAEGIRDIAGGEGLDLNGPWRVVFSAHGIPLRYIEQGSRYERYVRENCAAVAERAGVRRYTIGYQNHTNRPVEWTQPGTDDAIRGLAGAVDGVVVVPISFMHEQSETLSELDVEIRRVAAAAGLAFRRVPVPHDDPRFASLLADLVEPLAGGRGRADVPLVACLCRSTPATRCTNGGRPGAGDAAPLSR